MLKKTNFGPVIRYDLARTLAGRGRYWTTCYYLEGTLFDTGCAHTAPELEQALAGLPLYQIINTHTHEDHIGANGLLQTSRPGVQILAHPLALPELAQPTRTRPLHPYRHVFWGKPAPSQGQPIQEGERVQVGSFCFEGVHTPGHAADHLCLYEPEQGWLFSGDLYVGGRDRALRAGYDIRTIIASLKRIARLPIQALFPAAAKVRPDPAHELAEKITYLEELGNRIQALHREGMPIKDIARQVCGGPMWIEIFTLGHFTRQNLVRSYLGDNPDW
jgi:glyoxylase-like metal-dependent hydrolase (beta-lactamase superfamily II)